MLVKHLSFNLIIFASSLILCGLDSEL